MANSSAGAVLRAVLDLGSAPRSVVARHAGVSPATVTWQSRALVEAGLLIELPESPGPAGVRAAVDVLTAGRTTIVVAHRLATAADADLIAVVGGGKLVQIGAHADLVAVDGPYRRLWAAYVGDEVQHISS